MRKKVTLNELKIIIKEIINEQQNLTEGLPLGKSETSNSIISKLNFIVGRIKNPELERKAGYHASEIIKLIDEDSKY
jgi:hypothetical protein